MIEIFVFAIYWLFGVGYIGCNIMHKWVEEVDHDAPGKATLTAIIILPIGVVFWPLFFGWELADRWLDS